MAHADKLRLAHLPPPPILPSNLPPPPLSPADQRRASRRGWVILVAILALPVLLYVGAFAVLVVGDALISSGQTSARVELDKVHDELGANGLDCIGWSVFTEELIGKPQWGWGECTLRDTKVPLYFEYSVHGNYTQAEVEERAGVNSAYCPLAWDEHLIVHPDPPPNGSTWSTPTDAVTQESMAKVSEVLGLSLYRC